MQRENPNTTQILSVSFSTPAEKYTQKYLSQRLSLKSSKSKRFFLHPHIETRHLILPSDQSGGVAGIEESTGALLEKFRENGVKIGAETIQKLLQQANLQTQDVDYLCCVTSTGFIVPGLSALLMSDMGFRQDCQRADVVGMGCNAGLNGLNVAASWCNSNPEKIAILLCVEICSAIYTIDDEENTAIVNSLFGDGVAAAILKKTLDVSGPASPRAKILGFSSLLIPDSLDSLRFDYDDNRHRYSFFIDKDTPTKLASKIEFALYQLLERFSLEKKEIRHWIAHTGGAAILDAIQEKVGLSNHDLRHTRSVLKEYGNVSSSSFLFSYARLLEEKSINRDDYGIMVTMGPGLTIEMALLRW